MLAITEPLEGRKPSVQLGVLQGSDGQKQIDVASKNNFILSQIFPQTQIPRETGASAGMSLLMCLLCVLFFVTHKSTSHPWHEYYHGFMFEFYVFCVFVMVSFVRSSVRSSVGQFVRPLGFVF